MAGMMAKYLAMSFANEKVVSDPRVIRSCFPISTTSMSLVGLESRSTMLPASRAAWVPLFIATPTSACASAGASLVPSPVIATIRPPACSRRINSSFCSGVASRQEVVDPGLGGDGGGGDGVVTRDHHRADAHHPKVAEALPDPALHDILEVDRTQDPDVSVLPLGHDQRGAAGASDRFHHPSDLARHHPAALIHPARDCVRSPLPNLAAAEVHTAHPGRRGEGNEAHRRMSVPSRRPLPQGEPLLGEHDDASALGSLVGERGELGAVGQLLDSNSRQWHELDCLAIPEGDRSSLVEQQGVHVTGGLDGPPADRDHVLLGETIHARDADGGEEAADGRGNEADQQGDQDRRGYPGPTVGREGLEGRHREQEDDGEPGEQDGEGDFIGSSLAGGPFDQGDDPVDKGLAGVRGDANDHPVGQHPGTAGDGGAVACRAPE